MVEKREQRLYGEGWVTGSSTGYQNIALKVDIAGRGDTECRVFKIGKGKLAVDYIRWEPSPD